MTETNLIEDLRLLTPPDRTGLWLAVLAVGLVIAGFLFWRRRGGGLPVAEALAEATRPSWELALAELEALTPLLRPERSRDYGLASTAILRRYLEARYALQAPRLTTEEFLVAAATSPKLAPEDQRGLGHFLALGDLFKFGRFTATSVELQELQGAAVAFVLRSRPVETAPAEAAS